MKQFLRYQISGMVFIGWVLILYIATHHDFSIGKLNSFFSQGHDFALGGLLTALPIGVLIHQLSVLIKNWFMTSLSDVFSDFPKQYYLESLDGPNSKKAEYILERISNLNSFYYVRFDNGLLAPLLSILFSYHFFSFNPLEYWCVTLIMSCIGGITVIYIIQIHKEMQWYLKSLKNINKVILLE